jgi:low temperature requirement protein LtrA
MNRFQRSDGARGEQRVTALELFYDLVFVFAVTQVSHVLLTDLTWSGAGQALMVLLVVWWAWTYTTWVTNELNTESTAVRLVLLAIMFASLLMAVAIPEAFGSRALLFAGAYVAIQVGRHAFLTLVAADAGTIERRRASRILVWFVVAGVFWIAGGLAGQMRPWLWTAALAIDYSAPLFFDWVPGRRRIKSTSWDVETSHFAERFQLFIIIALGEAIVLTGATTAALDLDTARIAALALAFLSSAALWWLYFDYVASVAEQQLEHASGNRTRLARDGYTYLHVVLVAGIVLAAVGDELVIAHPTEVLAAPEIAVVVSGPAVYLLGHTLFRLRMARSLSTKRLLGALACLALAPLGWFVPAIALLLLTFCVLTTVIALEHLTAARNRSPRTPSPVEEVAV